MKIPVKIMESRKAEYNNENRRAHMMLYLNKYFNGVIGSGEVSSATGYNNLVNKTKEQVLAENPLSKCSGIARYCIKPGFIISIDNSDSSLLIVDEGGVLEWYEKDKILVDMDKF